MCRIAGFFGSTITEDRSSVVTNMIHALKHGGPDFQQVKTYDGQVIFGHARLSILDLSEAANQPFEWANYVVCYNGEIYNFWEIRQELEILGYTFTTTSDTEVIVKAYDAWGMESVKRFTGMFAFALWDAKRRSFVLVRDRLGVKPLYYILHDRGVYFFSELKAVYSIPGIKLSINRPAIAAFLQKGYIQGEHCVYEGVKKVTPGSILTFDSELTGQSHCFWQANDVGIDLFKGSYEDAKQAVRETLIKSIRYRLVSDVPVGVFLSGGIDSSLVTAIASKELKAELKTFTVAFDDKLFNEADLAKRIAATFQTDHSEFACTTEILLELIEELPFVYDEPFGDASALPTLFLSKMTSKHVKVALGGDGGDELFGGYVKYKFALGFKRNKRKFQLGAQLLRSLGTENAILLGSRFLGKNYTNTATKIRKFLHASLANDWIDFFDRSAFLVSNDLLKRLLTYDFQSKKSFPAVEDPVPQAFLRTLGILDMNTYLRDDLLTKVDRATMRYGLEAREPLLDHNLISLGLSLPDKWKISGGETKFILRDILSEYLPEEITKAPKSGFSVPVTGWLQKELKPQILTMVEDKSFMEKFYLNEGVLREIIDSFYVGKPLTDSLFIWNLLMLYKWHQKWTVFIDNAK